VEVRLFARGGEAQTTVARAEQIVRASIGQHIFGENDDQLETVVVRLLTEHRQTLATAESCTGGQLANRVTNVPGASAVFRCGWVTYSNEAKAQLLGVDGATLAAHGAVSEAVARAMAEGARQRGGVDYALAVTGIAGPTGGTPEKPVGTVFIALAVEGNTVVLNPVNPYDRETFKYVTSQQALELLRRSLLGQMSA
jgi:nicotinamide-nucleotide amidase